MVSTEHARRILGVPPSADAEAIRRAYRRLARERHPDAGGDAAAFQELQAAVARLLDRRGAPPAPPASPSTSSHTRPSTVDRVGGQAWGESAQRRWHEAPVDIHEVDRDVTLPDPPHAWTRDLVVAAAVRPSRQGTVLTPVSGVSRRPGSWLNRVAHLVSGDLMARFRIGPSTERGAVGHDVEIRLEFPSGRSRKRADATGFPPGWTRLRTPSTTRVFLVMPPSHERVATAVRAVDRLEEALDALGWPLGDWKRTGE